MSLVVVIGAGLSGCTVACTLADRGIDVALIEKTDGIGGRVRSYGCKAFERCQNCGVCLTTGLWDKVLNHKKIRIIYNAEIKDISGKPGDFSITVKTSPDNIYFEEVRAVVISTGFESLPGGISSHLHIDGTHSIQGLITGTQLEELMLNRTGSVLFESEPNSIAFLQCLGSRDLNEGGLYCSRVCCSYSTRAAKLMHHYYPECKITFFYMELQNVKQGEYYTELLNLGVEFVKCRPLKISCEKSITIEYDDPLVGIKRNNFDIVILSDGIHAGLDNNRLVEVCGVQQDKNGFLKAVGTASGIYVTGCAKTPLKIDETYADSLTVAGKILEKFL